MEKRNVNKREENDYVHVSCFSCSYDRRERREKWGVIATVWKQKDILEEHSSSAH